MEYPVFEDPPRTVRRGEVRWDEVLAPLTTSGNQRRWAKVWTFSSSGGATNAMKRLRERRVEVPKPEGEWEFTTRKEEDGQRSLYARYHPKTESRVARERKKVRPHRVAA